MISPYSIFLGYGPYLIFPLIIIGLIAHFTNRNNNLNNMDPNQIHRASLKDFFLNIGVIIALYTVVISLVNLLFTVINVAYPQITNGYNYYGSQSISWPVSIIIVSFPILIILVWFLENYYVQEPEKRNLGVHKFLVYTTLFIAGIVAAGDLITVLYYFIDGQELTTGFILKFLSVLVVSVSLFLYYVAEVRGKLTPSSRMIWRIVSTLIIVGSIVWGFSVLGSPRTQRLIKYDDQKVNDLININSQVQNYYQSKSVLPNTLTELSSLGYYSPVPVDQQDNKPYEYNKENETTYQLCAEFNKASGEKYSAYPTAPMMYPSNTVWTHPAGRYCFEMGAKPNLYPAYPPAKL